jgi:hypothetical protein
MRLKTCDNPFHFMELSDGTISHFRRDGYGLVLNTPPLFVMPCRTTIGFNDDICDRSHHTHPERTIRAEDMSTAGLYALLEAIMGDECPSALKRPLAEFYVPHLVQRWPKTFGRLSQRPPAKRRHTQRSDGAPKPNMRGIALALQELGTIK